MILPDDFDPDLPDDEVVAQLVASGVYTQDEAESTLRLIRSGFMFE